MNQVANKAVGKGVGKGVGGRSRALDVDHYVSLRIRQRRIMLGLTQQQMAELIGVTYQQAHKYETGINRISAGRLYQIAQALGVEIGYFFDDIEPDQQSRAKSSEMMPQQRMLLELARNFAAIGNRKHQDAICNLARVLAAGERAPG
jgi:transcriptional regulator with XRE-family HTH domain